MNEKYAYMISNWADLTDLTPFESLHPYNSKVLMIQVQAVASLHYGTFDQCIACESYQALRQIQGFLIGLSFTVTLD